MSNPSTDKRGRKEGRDGWREGGRKGGRYKEIIP
jgi:hypothetical protein